MQRFWEKVNTNGDCWEWQGATRQDGYGVFKLQGKTVQAHRQAYIFTHGDISSEILVLHKCDNRKCCNPNHLFLGSHHDNTHDMINKCRHPHKETNGRSKLTSAIVAKARADYAKGEVTLRTLAQEFGVSPQAMGNAVNGRNW